MARFGEKEIKRKRRLLTRIPPLRSIYTTRFIVAICRRPVLFKLEFAASIFVSKGKAKKEKMMRRTIRSVCVLSLPLICCMNGYFVQHCNLSAATVYIFMFRSDRKDIWLYYDTSFVKVFFILLLIIKSCFYFCYLCIIYLLCLIYLTC